MSQFQFRFPSVPELDAYDQHRRAEPSWTPPYLDAQDAEEAFSRTAFVDPISVMITFLQIED